MQGYQEGRNAIAGNNRNQDSMEGNKGRIADKQTDRTPTSGNERKNRRAARQDQKKHTRIVGISGKKKRPGINPGLEESIHIKSAITYRKNNIVCYICCFAVIHNARN